MRVSPRASAALRAGRPRSQWREPTPASPLREKDFLSPFSRDSIVEIRARFRLDAAEMGALRSFLIPPRYLYLPSRQAVNSPGSPSMRADLA